MTRGADGRVYAVVFGPLVLAVCIMLARRTVPVAPAALPAEKERAGGIEWFWDDASNELIISETDPETGEGESMSGLEFMTRSGANPDEVEMAGILESYARIGRSLRDANITPEKRAELERSKQDMTHRAMEAMRAARAFVQRAGEMEALLARKR